MTVLNNPPTTMYNYFTALVNRGMHQEDSRSSLLAFTEQQTTDTKYPKDAMERKKCGFSIDIAFFL